jgi:hypothetical protein
MGEIHSANSCDLPQAERIARLNDELRKTLTGGRFMITRGVSAHPQCTPAALREALSRYDEFDPDNDPHGERDFGSFDVGSAELLWKIDYYDQELVYASPDPADPAVTVRVLTVMLAEEY